MDPLLITAASGMKARMESLDMLANNLANTGTTGFKADREFYGLVQDALPVIERQWTDFAQGTLTPTGDPLNLGLSGPGLFALNSPAGVVYSRHGEFRISRANQLETLDGFTLRNVRDEGKPIQVNPQQAISIDRAGVVQQGGQIVGQIEIATVDQASVSLRKQGGNYFSLAPNVEAKPAQGVAVHQGVVEQSNVAPADASVRLVSVMRQFEMLQRAIALGAEMNKRAIDEVARTS